MAIKLVGVAAVNKRLSNVRKYAVELAGNPAPELVSIEAVDKSVELAKEQYKAPGAPKYPLRWKSQKQRKFVMAKLRKANNLPYQRRGRLESAWSGSSTKKAVTIANTARDATSGAFIAPFVIGAFQQPFHADTAWTKRSAKIERLILQPIFTDIKVQVKRGIASSKNA